MSANENTSVLIVSFAEGSFFGARYHLLMRELFGRTA
jgi:hypothetical protein